MRWYDTFWGFVVICVVGFVVVVVGAFALVAPGAYLFNRWQCSNIEEQTGMQTKYVTFQGCFVEVDGRWVPEDKWRAIE